MKKGGFLSKLFTVAFWLAGIYVIRKRMLNSKTRQRIDFFWRILFLWSIYVCAWSTNCERVF